MEKIFNFGLSNRNIQENVLQDTLETFLRRKVFLT